MSWTPRGFERYRQHFPLTPELALPHNVTLWLASRWDQADQTATARELRAHLRDTTVVFVRGFLGNWMPGNLVAPLRALRALDLDARLVRTATSNTVEHNRQRIAAALTAVPPRDRVIWCGHSKGGLECLDLLAQHPTWADRTAAVVLSQTPRGPSVVLESLLDRAHQDSLPTGLRRGAETLQRSGLHLVGADRGGAQLTGSAFVPILARIDAAPRTFPVLQTCSWSIRPTTWLDSFHERLSEVRPGVAHDGQFYLTDLIWPGLPHLLLPEVDHAQPVMGGYGFPHVRYWIEVLFGVASGEVWS